MIHIENYLSSYLLKNKYCAISGLGTLTLNREAARSRLEDSEIYPPTYSISFSPIGVIDDGLATFIANHENVSISKASNDIRTFSQDVKRELRATGRYDLDGVGYFTYNNDAIQFVQEDTLDLEQEPVKIYQEHSEEEETLADAKSFKDLNYTHSEKGIGRPRTGALLKYLLSLLLLIGLAAAAYFAYNYFKENRITETALDGVATIQESTTGVVNDSVSSASENMTGADTMNALSPTAPNEYNVAVISYNTKERAVAKAKKLVTYGNKASSIQIGDKYYVVITTSYPSNDTTRLVDSLITFFNPRGKGFIVK